MLETNMTWKKNEVEQKILIYPESGPICEINVYITLIRDKKYVIVFTPESIQFKFNTLKIIDSETKELVAESSYALNTNVDDLKYHKYILSELVRTTFPISEVVIPRRSLGLPLINKIVFSESEEDKMLKSNLYYYSNGDDLINKQYGFEITVPKLMEIVTMYYNNEKYNIMNLIPKSSSLVLSDLYAVEFYNVPVESTHNLMTYLIGLYVLESKTKINSEIEEDTSRDDDVDEPISNKSDCDGKNMSFGEALAEVIKGKKIFRHAWNDQGFVVYQKGYPEGIPCNKQTAEAWGMNEGDLFKCEPYLQIKTADGSHAMWTPTIRDIFANDWDYIH